jgi:hypothetical protein
MERGIDGGTTSEVEKVTWRERPATPCSSNPVYRLIFYSLRHKSTAIPARKNTTLFLQMQALDRDEPK